MTPTRLCRFRSQVPRSLVIASLAGCLTACAAAPVDSNLAEPGASPTVQAAAAPAAMTMREQVNFAVSDLSGRTGIAPAQIQLLQGGAVQWRSGALGCPEPGQFYTDALVPGALLTLGSEGRVYHYHATQGGQPFLCPDARRQPPVSGGALD